MGVVKPIAILIIVLNVIAISLSLGIRPMGALFSNPLGNISVLDIVFYAVVVLVAHWVMLLVFAWLSGPVQPDDGDSDNSTVIFSAGTLVLASAVMLYNIALLAIPFMIAGAAVLALSAYTVFDVLMKRRARGLTQKDMDDMEKKKPFKTSTKYILAYAAVEEILITWLLFSGIGAILSQFLPASSAFLVATALSAIIFTSLHRLKISAWFFITSQMLSCASFAVTGSVLVPILAHFMYNFPMLIKEK